MDFGSIIGFIMIAGISYIFNNAKNKSTQNSRSNRTQTTRGRESSKYNQNQRYDKNKEINARENTTNTMKTSLEDLFKDLGEEFNKNFGENPRNEQESTSKKVINTEIKTDPYKNTKLSKPSKNEKSIDLEKDLELNSKENTNSVYSGEIGNKEKIIEFNKKSIVQGVIMSEVLQKPKSLRR